MTDILTQLCFFLDYLPKCSSLLSECLSILPEKQIKKQNTRNDYNSNESQFCHFILVHPLQLVQAHEDHAVHVVWGTKPVNLIL